MLGHRLNVRGQTMFDILFSTVIACIVLNGFERTHRRVCDRFVWKPSGLSLRVETPKLGKGGTP